jgi:hypothetical protein
MITFVATQRCRDGADIIRAEWNGAGYEGKATHYGGQHSGVPHASWSRLAAPTTSGRW